MSQRPSRVTNLQRPEDLERIRWRVRREALIAREEAAEAERLAQEAELAALEAEDSDCLLYTSPSPRDS